MRRRKAKQPSQAEMEKSWCGVVWCGDSAGASQAEMENELRNSKKSTMRSKMTQIFSIFQQKNSRPGTKPKSLAHLPSVSSDSESGSAMRLKPAVVMDRRLKPLLRQFHSFCQRRNPHELRYSHCSISSNQAGVNLESNLF